MTKEELLKPRKKVMIDFPQWSTFKHKKGDILTKKGIHWVGKGTARSINENEIGDYPEIFRDMNWWEDREEKDMPEYIKYNRLDNGELKVVKVDEIIIDGINDKYRYGKSWNSFNSQDLPATKEEYEKQKP